MPYSGNINMQYSSYLPCVATNITSNLVRVISHIVVEILQYAESLYLWNTQNTIPVYHVEVFADLCVLHCNRSSNMLRGAYTVLFHCKCQFIGFLWVQCSRTYSGLHRGSGQDDRWHVSRWQPITVYNQISVNTLCSISTETGTADMSVSCFCVLCTLLPVFCFCSLNVIRVHVIHHLMPPSLNVIRLHVIHHLIATTFKWSRPMCT
jgi:hypothetical protein